jgi:N-acyl-D-amino-acid deacylase
VALRCDLIIRDATVFDGDGILETWINGQSAYVQGKGVVAPHAGRLLTRNRA